MNANNIILQLLKGKNEAPVIPHATCFAPVNIALIKYWGKRNTDLNLPITNSLSIALPQKGTTTTIRLNALHHDRYYLNGDLLNEDSEFAKRLRVFCNFFRFDKPYYFDIETNNNIPTAAGLASSASGFSALVLALNQLFAWQLDKTTLSILARLGSGSACRSLWNGFVEWEKGDRDDGLDCYAKPYIVDQNFLNTLRIGLLIFEKGKKILSSRQAMFNTVKTSPSYKNWPLQVENDLTEIKQAIGQHNFIRLGEISERNALAMHATMLDSQPSTDYCTTQTQEYREKIWALRQSGVPVYFTQDAGPNLKLLFQETVQPAILQAFPHLEILTLSDA